MRAEQIRLLICFVATHPEKMDDSKAMQWARLADLSDADMAAITSLESLGVPVRKKGTAPKSRIFSRKQQAKQTRKVGPSAVCSSMTGGLLVSHQGTTAADGRCAEQRHIALHKYWLLLSPCLRRADRCRGLLRHTAH